VLHLATTLSGGAGIAAERLHRAMVDRGVESKMLVARAPQKEERVQRLPYWQRSLLMLFREGISWRQNRSSIVEERGLFSMAQHGVSIEQHPWVQQAEAIYLHWVTGGFLSLRSLQKLFALSGKKFFWVMHDQWPFTGGCHYSLECRHFEKECLHCPSLKGVLQKKERAHLLWRDKRKLFEKADLTLIAPSRWLKREANHSSLMREKRVVQIPNAIPLTRFEAIEKRVAQESLGLSSAVKWGAIFADRNRYKGWALFLQALQQLQPAEEWGWIISGEEALLKDLPSGWQIKFLPPRRGAKELSLFYSAADFFLVPSIADNYPNVALESLTCNTLLVATAVGGLQEIVEEWGGLLSEPNSARSLAQQIEKAFCGEATAVNREGVTARHSGESVVALHQRLWERGV
jgi:glycosyltransferase involved in cell wall biosynthesis